MAAVIELDAYAAPPAVRGRERGNPPCLAGRQHVGRKAWRPGRRNGSMGVPASRRAAEEKLRSHLGTKVRIVRQGNGSAARGRIEIEFYSDEDLDRLYTCIMERGR